MKQAKQATVRHYRFVGDGAGVPGLPHDVTDVEAQALGLPDVLSGAIDNGSYIEITDQLVAGG